MRACIGHFVRAQDLITGKARRHANSRSVTCVACLARSGNHCVLCWMQMKAPRVTCSSDAYTSCALQTLPRWVSHASTVVSHWGTKPLSKPAHWMSLPHERAGDARGFLDLSPIRSASAQQLRYVLAFWHVAKPALPKACFLDVASKHVHGPAMLSIQLLQHTTQYVPAINCFVRTDTKTRALQNCSGSTRDEFGLLCTPKGAGRKMNATPGGMRS